MEKILRRISNFQQTRADELLQALEREDGQVDAIFQSADALNGLLAVSQRPEKFNNVIFAYPAGLTKQPSIVKSAPRVVRGMAANARTKLRAKYSSPSTLLGDSSETQPRVKSKRNGSGGFRVANSVALSSQGSLLHGLQEKEGAPSVSLVLGLQDHMFPPERVLIELESSYDVSIVMILDTAHGISNDDGALKKIVELLPVMEQLKTSRKQDGGNSSTREPLINRLILPETISPERREAILNIVRALDVKSGAAQEG